MSLSFISRVGIKFIVILLDIDDLEQVFNPLSSHWTVL